ncbi:MAG: glycosyltransferase [Solirubrobacterales bacterium]
MSAPLLSATLIVRDEERNLPDCLRSIDGVADEVVVVDTGSTDGSVEIARELGARVVSHPWRSDFSEARNVALEVARGEWILYLDADERLRSVDRDAVSGRLCDASETAFRILLHPFAGATPFFEYRLWRADPEIRFRGVIHEQVVDDINRVAARDGRPVSEWGDLELDHLGYDGDQASKHRRNLPMLRRQLEADPNNIFNWNHLARVLIATGDPDGAEEALEEAVALARVEGSPSSYSSLAWGELVRLRHDRGADITSLLAEGKVRWPENWLLVWIEGNILLDAGALEEAAACFERLLVVDVASLPEQGVAYDGRLFGSFAHSSLGLALFRLGRYEEAAEAYAAASRLEPDCSEHAAKQALAEARARAAP